MLFVPLSFVIAAFLIALFWRVVWRDQEAPLNWPFLILILVAATQSFLSGLRWGYGMDSVMYLAPVLAAFVPTLTYAGVSKLVGRPKHSIANRMCVIVAPIVTILVLTFFWRDAIDVALILMFVGYATMILFLLRSGTDALKIAPFSTAQSAFRAIIFTAVFLLLIAALDTYVSLNFAWSQGKNAVSAISAGQLGGLFFLAIAAAYVGHNHLPADLSGVEKEPQTVADVEVLSVLKTLMETKRAYRDPNLNLDRLGRKTGITVRQISSAINRATTKNVSQWVNDYRISEACLALGETEKSVTEIMFDVGFQTKSNFNREFRRITGMTPLEWRAAVAEPVRDSSSLDRQVSNHD